MSLDINDVNSDDPIITSNSISESFAELFQSLNLQLKRMTGELNSLQLETKKLGTANDSHILRENMYMQIFYKISNFIPCKY